MSHEAHPRRKRHSWTTDTHLQSNSNSRSESVVVGDSLSLVGIHSSVEVVLHRTGSLQKDKMEKMESRRSLNEPNHPLPSAQNPRLQIPTRAHRWLSMIPGYPGGKKYTKRPAYHKIKQ